MDELIPVLEETNRLLAEYLPRSPIDLPVVISILALLAAIAIPIYIARRQDKIALFEKRFASYSDLLKLKNYADVLNKKTCSFSAEDILAENPDLKAEMSTRAKVARVLFGTIFTYIPAEGDSVEVAQIAVSTVKRLEISVHTLPFLYDKHLPKNKDLTEEIGKIFESFSLFVTDITLSENIEDKNRTDFITSVTAFTDQYAELFEKYLKL